MELIKNMRYKLIRLTSDINSLDIVKEKLLEKVNKEPLNLKHLPEDLPDEEKYYYSFWNTEDSSEGIHSILLHLGGPLEQGDKIDKNEIQYLKATSICEYATRRKKDKQDQILSKQQRLNIDEIDVIFVCQNDEVYAIAFTTEMYSLKRIKTLIGYNFISSETNINNLQSDLFHWLFYRYTKEKRELGKHIILENIVGFTGIIMTNDHIFEGKSDQTADLIVTKAFISSGYSIQSIKIKLYSGNGMLTFFVNENDELYVERGSNIGLVFDESKEDIAMPIFLFFVVLPELRNLYEEERKKFIGGEKPKFNAEIGKEVIRSIANKNKIDLKSL